MLEPIAAPLYDPRHEHDACGVGFIADIDGSHATRTVPMALEALAALAHRGARGADDRTGDGAGISFPISRRFRRRLLAEANVSIAPRQRVAIGMCFLPPSQEAAATALIAERAAWAGLAVAGWRRVPVQAALVEDRAIGGSPSVWQAAVVGRERMTSIAFARRLSLARRSVEATAAGTSGLEDV